MNVSELGGGLQAMLQGWAGAGALQLGERELRPDAPRKVQCLPLPGTRYPPHLP